jgi:hypothetical protein
VQRRTECKDSPRAKGLLGLDLGKIIFSPVISAPYRAFLLFGDLPRIIFASPIGANPALVRENFF